MSPSCPSLSLVAVIIAEARVVHDHQHAGGSHMGPLGSVRGQGGRAAPAPGASDPRGRHRCRGVGGDGCPVWYVNSWALGWSRET